MTKTPEPRAFIIDNLRLQPAPFVPEICLYAAHPGSGLWRLLGRDNVVPPYWAYHWAGGTVLARYILDHPQAVAGRRVIDLGTGSSIVAIAAAKCGARHVMAIDIDPIAVVAAGLNAKANGVVLDFACLDIVVRPPPDCEVILVGDLFYSDLLAASVLPFLRQCRAAGIAILIGDPGRSALPRAELQLVAEYPVTDFGDARHTAESAGGVYTLIE